MDIPAHDLSALYESIKSPIDEAIEEVIRETDFILGEAVERFEESFAEYCDVDHCVGVGSGTAAVRLILEALDPSPGDEIITTPFTFIGTVEPILHSGAEPVFADIDPETYTLDPSEVEPLVNENTLAIMTVHLYGQPDHMDRLRELADEHDVWLIEDAAQAHGATWKGSKVGGLADAAAFSFYPGKNLGAFGDAGGVTTSNDRIADRIRGLRDHGRSDRYRHEEIGFNHRMDGLQGAVLDVKIDHLDGWNQGRRENAERYRSALSDLDLILPTVASNSTHVYHQFIVRCSNRDQVKENLSNRGIGVSSPYSLPLHLQPCFDQLGYEQGDLPNAEKAAEEVLSLPVHSFLTEEEMEFIVKSVHEELS